MENRKDTAFFLFTNLKEMFRLPFFLTALGVTLCICLDTWDQIPYIITASDCTDSHYYFFNSITFGGFYGVYAIPTLAAIPYAMSYCREYQSNTLRLIVARIGSRGYCRTKVMSSFLSGGLCVLCGEAFFLLISSLFVDLIDPKRLFEVKDMPFFALLSQGNGGLYFVVLFFLQFLRGGIWALVAMLISSSTANYYTALASPLILSFGIGNMLAIFRVSDILRLDLAFRARITLVSDKVTLIICTVSTAVLILVISKLFYKKVKGRLLNE